MQKTIWVIAIGLALFGTRANAQVSDDVVKIGVLNDQSGIYADLSGQGSVVAARMAVEDFGGTVLGKPIEVAELGRLAQLLGCGLTTTFQGIRHPPDGG